MRKVVVFDLDDTLYKEIDFLKSAFKEIAEMIGEDMSYDFMLKTYLKGGNAFYEVIDKYQLSCSVDDLLYIYRHHIPKIHLTQDATRILTMIKGKFPMGLISDGRSVQQRNKIKALGIDKYISEDNILISEEFGHHKPEPNAFLFFMKKYPLGDFFYIGDNPAKDFVAPNQLGWTTICLLDDGRNIHKQWFSLSSIYQPKIKIKSLSDCVSGILR